MPGEKGFRYAYAGNHIKTILDKIQSTGRPDKLNSTYIRDTWVLRNAQYGAVLDLLEDMEFIDSAGVPSPLYAEYQNPKLAKKTLAKGIIKAYAKLFKAFPNAPSLPTADIEGYFRQQTGKDAAVINKMVTTFRALCNSADFTGVEEVEEELEHEPKKPPATKRQGVTIEPRLQLNIEIHISADTPDEKIETMFRNMRTYLLPNE